MNPDSVLRVAREPALFQQLEPRLLMDGHIAFSVEEVLRPDLTAVIDMQKVPPIVQVGDRKLGIFKKIPVVITNDGVAPAVGTITIDLYASLDQEVSVPPDTLLGTLEVRINLAPGKSKTYSISKVSVPGIAFDQYYLIASLDTGNAIAMLFSSFDSAIALPVSKLAIR